MSLLTFALVIRSNGPANQAGTATDGGLGVSGDQVPEGSWLLHIARGTELVQSGQQPEYVGPFVPYDLSPDGTQLLGTSQQRIDYAGGPGQQDYVSLTRQTELVLIDIASGDERVLARADATGSLAGPVLWSADGRFIAYRETIWEVDPGVEHPQDRVQLETVCVVDANGGDPTCYPQAAPVASFGWLPDASGLVIGGEDGGPISRLNIKSGDVRTLVPATGSSSIDTALDRLGYGKVINIIQPAVSESGRYIGATAQTTHGGSVPVVFTADGEFVASGEKNNDLQLISWSPTDDILVYSTGVQISTSDQWHVYQLDPTTGRSKDVLTLESPNALITSITWSPSGRWIAVGGSEASGTDAVRVIDTTDGVVTQVEVQSPFPQSLADWGA